jgi:hypothetical protein
MMQRSYQEAGKIARQYKPFTAAIEAPSPGSFVITLKLIRTEGLDQQNFFIPEAGNLIDEVITGIQLVNESNQIALRERIPDTRYYNNFVSLAKDMAPDGDRIKFVKFSSSRQTAALTSARKDIAIEQEPSSGAVRPEGKTIQIQGILDFATSRKTEMIGLTTEDGTEYQIIAEEGMEDVVHNYYKEMVIVTGRWVGRKILLSDVQLAE